MLTHRPCENVIRSTCRGRKALPQTGAAWLGTLLSLKWFYCGAQHVVGASREPAVHDAGHRLMASCCALTCGCALLGPQSFSMSPRASTFFLKVATHANVIFVLPTCPAVSIGLLQCCRQQTSAASCSGPAQEYCTLFTGMAGWCLLPCLVNKHLRVLAENVCCMWCIIMLSHLIRSLLSNMLDLVMPHLIACRWLECPQEPPLGCATQPD